MNTVLSLFQYLHHCTIVFCEALVGLIVIGIGIAIVGGIFLLIAICTKEFTTGQKP